MTIYEIIRKSLDNPEYFEGIRDAVKFLEIGGQGIASLQALVEEIEKKEIHEIRA